MKIIVQKFGGSSLADPDKIRNAAKRLIKAREEGYDVVAVLSAMGKTTDELIALAHAVSDSPSAREMDMLVTTGEQVSVALMAMALEGLGSIQRDEGHFDKAKKFDHDAHQLYLSLYGPTNPDTLRLECTLALHLWLADGDRDRAEVQFRQLIEKCASAWGYEIYLTLNPMILLALILEDKGQNAEAEKILIKVNSMAIAILFPISMRLKKSLKPYMKLTMLNFMFVEQD